MISVGDTFGIMTLGYPDTLAVTMDDMVRHCQAVRRGVRNALLVGDLPFGSYEVSVEAGLANAVRLVTGGADLASPRGGIVPI